MKSTVRLHAYSRTTCGVMLLAGLSACGSSSVSRVDAAAANEAGTVADAPTLPDAGRAPTESTLSTCKDNDNVTVGNYVVQTNYWNKSTCPGTQCLDINKTTAAFTVTQGPLPCGADKVASYPNVLYGCSFGNCSPGSMLPLPVSSLSTVTSDWDFTVGGTAADMYNVSYDIWFCTDNSCGNSGFPGGTELMIWLDHKNVTGWQKKLATVAIAGHTWEVWQATMGTGAEAWTYLAYMIVSPTVTSVSKLDLNAFVQDGISRGLIKDSWYLYAIQAGTELRTGGVPFTNNSFSVSINGVTPSTKPITTPPAGPACDGGMPSAEGSLSVSNGFVSAGLLHGYGAAWGWVGGGSAATICITPTCTAPGSLQTIATIGNGVAPLTTEPIACLPALAPSSLCTSGTVTADPSYNQVAGIGFNLNQGRPSAGGPDADGGVEADGGANADGGEDPDGGAGIAFGSITIPKSITYSLVRSGSLAGNNALRPQITGTDNTHYCYFGKVESGKPIPIEKFNSKCWDDSGKFATPSTPIKRTDILIPGSASTDLPFSFCLTDVTVQ